MGIKEEDFIKFLDEYMSGDGRSIKPQVDENGEIQYFTAKDNVVSSAAKQYEAGNENIDGYGNSVINIKNSNGIITQSIFTIDSHAYTGTGLIDIIKMDYDNIHANQIEWYKWAVNGIAANAGHVVESSAIMHIPVYEVKTTWAKYYDKENDCFTGPYAERYPLLGKWAELMYQRLDEYNAQVVGGMDKIKAAKTSNIQTQYTNPAYKVPYNLNQYLGTCRDNVYENNAFINTAEATVGQKNQEAYINTTWKNNAQLTSAQNPFVNNNFADESAYNKIRTYVSGFDSIPFDKIGLVDESDYTVNAKTEAVSPVNTTDTAVSMQDLTLQWKTVDGAQQYYVELSRNENFTDIFEVATTFELSHKVIADLEANQVYYWRVTTIPKAVCSVGSQLTSDTFAFKIAKASETVARNIEVARCKEDVDGTEDQC